MELETRGIYIIHLTVRNTRSYDDPWLGGWYGVSALPVLLYRPCVRALYSPHGKGGQEGPGSTIVSGKLFTAWDKTRGTTNCTQCVMCNVSVLPSCHPAMYGPLVEICEINLFECLTISIFSVVWVTRWCTKKAEKRQLRWESFHFQYLKVSVRARNCRKGPT